MRINKYNNNIKKWKQPSERALKELSSGYKEWQREW